VHGTQPWILDTHGDSADLYERPEIDLPRQDPGGRDRVISGGAALVNLELAIRALGRDASVSFLPDSAHPRILGRVRASGLRDATGAEIDRYGAIFRRRSYRSPFSLHRISAAGLRSLAHVTVTTGVQARVIDPRTESAALADLFRHAATVLRGDQAYQRELAAWLPEFPEPPADGAALPWAGLVRADTRIPDAITFTQRLMAEGLLVIITRDDSRRDHLLAGAAMERIWLTAITQGLVVSVLTQPLQLHEVRAGLIERLQLAGYPQLILRVGYPACQYMPLVG
jgi:hypothetical protein